jgi:hypothetical protein
VKSVESAVPISPALVYLTQTQVRKVKPKCEVKDAKITKILSAVGQGGADMMLVGFCILRFSLVQQPRRLSAPQTFG